MVEVLVYDKSATRFIPAAGPLPAERAKVVRYITEIVRALNNAVTVASNPYLSRERVLALAIARAVTNSPLSVIVGPLEPDDVNIEPSGVADVYARYADMVVRVTL